MNSTWNDAADTVKLLNHHMEAISRNVIGMEEIIRQACFAILTGEHMLLLSRTGMAKSYLAASIFNLFSGAAVFSAQASKDQTPDNYFGPYDIEEFKKGVIRHNARGSIIDARLVFLDEFFDASDMVLRSLLSVLNERRFINGPEQVDCSVHTAIATANYMRLNEVTEAVLDRFTYKSIIPVNSNIYSQLLIDRSFETNHGKPPVPEDRIPFERILNITNIINNGSGGLRIDVPDFIYFMKNAVINRYAVEMRKLDPDFAVSPRKAAKLSLLLKAVALTRGRPYSELEDVRELYFGLCTLNSRYQGKSGDKSEKDIFLEAFDRTMVHMNTTGAADQVRLLLEARKIFMELKKSPERRDVILKKKGFFQEIKNILSRIFPLKRLGEEELTIDILRKDILDISPAVEEVKELKDGLLLEFREVY